METKQSSEAIIIHPILVDIGLTLLSELVTWIFSSKQRGDAEIGVTGIAKKNLVMVNAKRFFAEHKIVIDNVEGLIEDLYQLIKFYDFFTIGAQLVLFIIEKIWMQEASGMFLAGTDKKEQVMTYAINFMTENNLDFDPGDLDLFVDDIVVILNRHQFFKKRGV